MDLVGRRNFLIVTSADMLVVLFPELALSASVCEPISGLRRTFDTLTDLAVGLNALCGVAAIFGPFVALVGGRELAARTAVVLASATAVLALAVIVFLKLAAITDT